jgi:streptogramin lyase
MMTFRITMIPWTGRDPRRCFGTASGGRRRPIARLRVEGLESRSLLSVTINEFYIPTNPGPAPTQITAGPDGNLWFTEAGADKIGEINPITHAISEFPIPTPSPSDGIIAGGIAAGPDGNVWFTELEADKIGEINPTTHAITEFPIPTAHSSPEGIIAGSDGNVWFTETGANKIGEINPANHAIAEFSPPPQEGVLGGPSGITIGPDGNVWFTEVDNQIGRINPSTHAFTQFTTPTQSYAPSGITSGRDGNLWFVENAGNHAMIGQISSNTGAVAELAIPTTGGEPRAITAGPDGNLWFTEEFDLANKIGEIDLTTHAISEFPVPASGSHPYGITAGPDGNVWFTEQAGQNIGQVVLAPSTARHGDGPTITSVRRPGPRARAGALVLSFDEPLDPARAQDLGNYQLVEQARRGRTIRIRSAVYDPAARTVTLSAVRRLRPRQRFQLTVIGTGPSGVTDSSGNLLDGQRTGHPGSNFVAII